MRRLLRVDSMQSMIFNCFHAECFVVDMQGGVQRSQLNNSSPGQLYTFIIRQNQTGGHSFNWPMQCINPMPIDQRPHAISTQNFIASTGNRLLAIEPGSVSSANL